jgi:hypothetical protein
MTRSIARLIVMVAVMLVGCKDSPVAKPRPESPTQNKSSLAKDVPDKEPPSSSADADEAVARAAFVDSKIGIAFPHSLGDMEFGEHYAFPAPGLGYSLRYQGVGAMRCDLYVYDHGLKDIPNGYRDPIFVEEVASAERGIRHYEDLGQYLDVKKLSHGIYPDDQHRQAIRFQTSQFQFRQIAGPQVTFTGLQNSETYICGFKRHFIKARISYPTESAESSVESRDKALRQLASLLKTK